MSNIIEPEPLSIEPIEISAKKQKKSREERTPSSISLIFRRTFQDLMSIKRVLPYIFLSVIFPFIFTSVAAGDLSSPLSNFNINYQITTLSSYFVFYAFFWNAGILLWMFCGITASTFISGEENNGTLVFLLTKPITRTALFFGKFLGYFVNMAILQFFSLFLGLTLTASLFQTSMAVFAQTLIFLIPTYLFGLLMITVVGIIFGFLSIVNRKAVINILILMLLIIMIYFIGIIFRFGIPSYYENWRLYLVDIGYNLSIIFTAILKPFGFDPNPFYQTSFGLFFGTYVNQFTDISAFLSASDTDQGLTFILPETGYINPIISIVVLIAITSIFLAIGLIVLNKKDVSG